MKFTSDGDFMRISEINLLCFDQKSKELCSPRVQDIQPTTMCHTQLHVFDAQMVGLFGCRENSKVKEKQFAPANSTRLLERIWLQSVWIRCQQVQ